MDISDLGLGVDLEELYDVVKSMGVFKAPGPNGFQALLYHSQWDVVGVPFSVWSKRSSLLPRVLGKSMTPSYP